MKKSFTIIAVLITLSACKKESTQPSSSSVTPVKTTSPLTTACIFSLVPRATGGYGYRTAECHPGMSANQMGMYLSEHAQFASGQMAHNCQECDSIAHTL